MVRANYSVPRGRLIYPSPPTNPNPGAHTYESYNLMTQVTHSVKPIS